MAWYREAEAPPTKARPVGVLVTGRFWPSLLCAVFGHAENIGWMDRSRGPNGEPLRMGSRCAQCGRLLAWNLRGDTGLPPGFPLDDDDMRFFGRSDND